MAKTTDIEVKLVGEDLEALRDLAARVAALETWRKYGDTNDPEVIGARLADCQVRLTELEAWRRAHDQVERSRRMQDALAALAAAMEAYADYLDVTRGADGVSAMSATLRQWAERARTGLAEAES